MYTHGKPGGLTLSTSNEMRGIEPLVHTWIRRQHSRHITANDLWLGVGMAGSICTRRKSWREVYAHDAKAGGKYIYTTQKLLEETRDLVICTSPHLSEIFRTPCCKYSTKSAGTPWSVIHKTRLCSCGRSL
jgi:hypothetical protein